jgi:hypothetical protein
MQYSHTFVLPQKTCFLLQIFNFTIESSVRLRNFAAHRLGIPGLEATRTTMQYNFTRNTDRQPLPASWWHIIVPCSFILTTHSTNSYNMKTTNTTTTEKTYLLLTVMSVRPLRPTIVTSMTLLLCPPTMCMSGSRTGPLSLSSPHLRHFFIITK